MQNKYQNLGGWADNFTHRPSQVTQGAQVLEDAMNNRGPDGSLHITWNAENQRVIDNNPENRPFLHALELIAARNDPSSLENPNDQYALNQVLEKVGGPEHLGFDGKSLTKIGRALAGQYAASYEKTLEHLESIPDDPESLARMARATLQSSSRDGSFDPDVPHINLEVLTDPDLTMAMRIIAYRSDLPDFSVPGTDSDVAKTYFAKHPDKPAYTAENILELVNANRAYSKKQSLIKLNRLANEYNLEVDMNKSVKENLDGLTSQLEHRAHQYKQAENQLGWFTNSISEDPIGRTEEPVRQNLLNLIGETTDQALDSAGESDWNSTRENLAQLHTTLRVIDDQYAADPIESLNLDQVVESLDGIADKAAQAQKWGVLDNVYACLNQIVRLLNYASGSHIKDFETSKDKLLERVSQVRGEIRKLRGDPDNEISRLLTLRHTVETQIKPNIRDERGQEFITHFQHHLDAAIYQDMHDELVDELTEKFAYLEKGGSSDSVSFELGAGWGAGPALNISLGLKGSSAVSGGDDRRVREGTSFGLTIGAKGNVGAASIGGSIGTSVKKGKTFKSVDDFVEYHQDDIMQAMLRGLPSLPDSLRDKDTLERARQLNAMTQSELDEFNLMAQNMGVFGASEGFSLKTLKAPVPTRTVTVSNKAALEAGVGGKSFVGASIKAEVAANETTFHKQVNLLDYLKANLDDLDGVQARSNPMEISIRDFPENETIEDFNARVAALGTRQERIEAIFDGMSRVAGEFGSYCQTVTNYDQLKSPFSLIYKSPMEKNFQRMKHEYQHNRGVRGREDYVRACLTTHAHLLKALKDQCKPGEFESLDLSAYDDPFRMPKLPMSDKQIKALRKEITKVGTAVSAGFEVSTSLPAGMKLSAAATISEIEGNSNPDNDGVYLNLQFAATNDSLQFLPYIVDELQSLDAKQLKDPDALAKATKSAIKSAAAGKVGSSIAGAVLPDLGLSSSTTGVIELNFIKSHGLALQYARTLTKVEGGGKVEGVPVGGGATLTVGASASRQRNVGERIGTKTISYVVTQINGFKLAGGDWKEGFREWCTQPSNKEQIRELAINMATDDTIANLETIDTLEGLNHNDAAISNELQAAMKVVLDSEGGPITDEAVGRFADAFADVVVKSAGRGGLARSKLNKAGWVT